MLLVNRVVHVCFAVMFTYLRVHVRTCLCVDVCTHTSMLRALDCHRTVI